MLSAESELGSGRVNGLGEWSLGKRSLGTGEHPDQRDVANMFGYWGSLEFSSVQFLEFSSVQSVLSRVQLFATPWIAAGQASLSISNSQNLLKLMSIVSVMPSNYLILCRPLLLPSIFPSIRIFSNESVLHIRFRSVYF